MRDDDDGYEDNIFKISFNEQLSICVQHTWINGSAARADKMTSRSAPHARDTSAVERHLQESYHPAGNMASSLHLDASKTRTIPR